MDFDEMETKVSQGGSELMELKATLKQLTARVDRQALVIQVLKDMLLSRGEFNEDDFLKRLERVFTEKADAKTCQKCGKVLNAKQSRCMYCGQERPLEFL